MKCTPDLQWKYLRETDKKFFDKNKNTSLKSYLTSIFPNHSFDYQSSIKRAEIPENVSPRRYTCDSICRKLKLVVEFDGVNHYMDSQIVLNDRQRDEWFSTLGYTIIRVPYWIQLSRDVIFNLFGIITEEEYCKLDFSFYNPENDTVDVNILPGNMCELGRARFVNEFNQFNSSIRFQIFNDLLTCADHVDRILIETVLPRYLLSRMKLDDILHQFDLEFFNRFINKY